MTVRPEDLLAAAHVCVEALTPALDGDWSVNAGELHWNCRWTLAHISGAQLLYAAHLARRATERLPGALTLDLDAKPSDLLAEAQSSAAILADVIGAAPAGTRAYHPAGMADPEGFAAMGCDETLVHTYDIACGLRVRFDPPRELCAKVVARIFPWAPADVDPLQALLWANGRIALGDRERLDENWYWQCSPLSEWDGTVNRRTAPPRWK